MEIPIFQVTLGQYDNKGRIFVHANQWLQMRILSNYTQTACVWKRGNLTHSRLGHRRRTNIVLQKMDKTATIMGYATSQLLPALLPKHEPACDLEHCKYGKSNQWIIPGWTWCGDVSSMVFLQIRLPSSLSTWVTHQLPSDTLFPRSLRTCTSSNDSQEWTTSRIRSKRQTLC